MAGLVERLVRVVASAFYSDECIVILEAMIREKFLKDDDRMGDAVNLQTRQVRKTLAELQQDHVISSEVLNDKHLGGGSSTTYWYIDYRHFVNVIKYRLYKMNEFLKEREQEEMVRQIYRCGNPGCNREYTALEAQRLILPGQYDFRCGHCGDPLLECDNNERLVSIQNLQKKFKDQMNKCEGIHDGITEILRKLSEYVGAGHTLPTNLPSENRALGVGGEASRPMSGRNGNLRGGSTATAPQDASDGKNNAQSFLFPYGAQQTEIVVDIAKAQAEDEILLGKRTQDTKINERPVKQMKSQPEFLKKSTISGHLTGYPEEEKYAEVPSEVTPDPTMDLGFNGNSTMTEEQRQAAFKKAYMEELMRYNTSKNGEGYDGSNGQQVQVQLEKEVLDGDDNDEENDLDVEWEYCGRLGIEDNSEEDQEEVVLLVQGKPKRISQIDLKDNYLMTKEEYENFYEICSS